MLQYIITKIKKIFISYNYNLIIKLSAVREQNRNFVVGLRKRFIEFCESLQEKM